jgi:predicted phage gp36 major capsid-like protein
MDETRAKWRAAYQACNEARKQFHEYIQRVMAGKADGSEAKALAKEYQAADRQWLEACKPYMRKQR